MLVDPGTKDVGLDSISDLLPTEIFYNPIVGSANCGACDAGAALEGTCADAAGGPAGGAPRFIIPCQPPAAI